MVASFPHVDTWILILVILHVVLILIMFMWNTLFWPSWILALHHQLPWLKLPSIGLREARGYPFPFDLSAMAGFLTQGLDLIKILLELR